MEDGGSASGSDDEKAGGYSLVWRSIRTAMGSDSYLLRAYVVAGSLLAAAIGVGFLLALPNWIYQTLAGTGTVTFSRASLLLTAVLLVAPLFAPTYFAARRHRNGTATRRRDVAYGASGFLFVFGLYASLLVSAPPGYRERPPAAIGPVVESLYGLDPAFALLPPVLAALVMVAVDRMPVIPPGGDA